MTVFKGFVKDEALDDAFYVCYIESWENHSQSDVMSRIKDYFWSFVIDGLFDVGYGIGYESCRDCCFLSWRIDIL